MSLAIHLLGLPQIDRTDGDTCNFRSRKSWAVLAYLILSERLPTRSQLALLLSLDGSPVSTSRTNARAVPGGPRSGRPPRYRHRR